MPALSGLDQKSKVSFGGWISSQSQAEGETKEKSSPNHNLLSLLTILRAGCSMSLLGPPGIGSWLRSELRATFCGWNKEFRAPSVVDLLGQTSHSNPLTVSLISLLEFQQE